MRCSAFTAAPFVVAAGVAASEGRRSWLAGRVRFRGIGGRECAAPELRAVGEVIRASVDGAGIDEGDAAGDIYASAYARCRHSDIDNTFCRME